MSNELATTNHQLQHYRQATDVAGVCREVVLKTARQIQGRKYVQVEGWQSIATAHGCVASARDVERIEGGFRAIGEVRRMDTGAVIATAEGFVGDDEPTWAKRAEYARRAMAQTRAISRACRSAFAHVVVLMDAGLSTTPAEEVPTEGFDDAPAPRVTRPAAPRKPVAQPETIDVDAEELPHLPPAELAHVNMALEPARKKQVAAQPLQAADYITARLIKVNRQEKTSKAGKPFVKWGAFIECEGAEKAVWANTINRDLGEVLDGLKGGQRALVQIEETQYGLDLLDLRASDIPETPAADVPPYRGEEIVSDSDIPF
jgi:hypothetical protein